MKASGLMSRFAMIAAAMLVLPAVAVAQLSEYEKSVNVTTTETAKVKAVDPAARTVTLEMADGGTRTIKCGKEMANFDQIKAGDQVKAMAMEQIAVAVGKEGSAPAGGEGAGDDGVIARAPRGGKPGIFISRSEEAKGKIDAIDAAKHTVTISAADGTKRQVKVSPDVPLTGVKQGDEVTLRLSKGVGLWVQSPEDAAQPAGATQKPDDAAAGWIKEGDVAIDTASVDATVSAIDAEKRIVTLKGSGGQTKQIQLGKDAINFDQVKVGDKVRATVAEEVAVAVAKGELPPGAGEGTIVSRMPKGAKPGILIAESDKVSGKIESIDADKRTITLAEATGQPRTIKAGANVNLAELKPGDEVNARVTQALVIVVEKP